MRILGRRPVFDGIGRHRRQRLLRARQLRPRAGGHIDLRIANLDVQRRANLRLVGQQADLLQLIEETAAGKQQVRTG